MSLDDFVGREEELEKITRFNIKIRKPMFYRTNDLIHSRRVELMVWDVLPEVKKIYGIRLDSEKALAIGKAHDDHEIITTDVSRYLKDRMTKEQLESLKEKELEAISQLANRWPKKIGNYEYSALLYHSVNKDCLEAQLVSWLDKVDAFCESLHEVFAGNKIFRGTAKAYIEKVNSVPQKYPVLQKLIGQHPYFMLPNKDDREKIDLAIEKGKYHTAHSITFPTYFSCYDRWKVLTTEFLGREHLLEVKERKRWHSMLLHHYYRTEMFIKKKLTLSL